MTRLNVGDDAPDFALPDQDGTPHTLAEHRGRRVILYFYPAAGTPGCTKEACDFRDDLTPLAEAGFDVIGVSKDDPEALRAFRDAEHLPFPLLSDPDHAVQDAYGAWGEKSLYGRTVTGSIRSTFVIDAEGRLEHALYNVKATGHVASLKKKLGIAA